MVRSSVARFCEAFLPRFFEGLAMAFGEALVVTADAVALGEAPGVGETVAVGEALAVGAV